MFIDTEPQHISSSLQHAVVLVVDDDPIILDIINNALSLHYRVFTVQSGEEAIGFCVQHAPDLMLLDLHMPKLDGLMTCKMLKAIPNMENCPIVFSTADTTIEKELECWDAGATDFVTKPIVTHSIIKRIKAHIQAKLHNDLRDNMVFIDESTGLYNRRYFNDFYNKQVSLANRNEGPLSLIIFELVTSTLFDSEDNTDMIESCLQSMAEIVSQQLSRPTDTIFRYSANRLAILLPDTYIFGAKHIAQKVLSVIAELKASEQQHILLKTDITAGLASLEALPRSMTMLDQAEKNLLQNKQSGSSLVA